MTAKQQQTALAYVCALVGILIATAIRYILDPILGEHVTFSVYFLAVALAAWAGGLSPALATAIVSSIVGTYMCTEPRGSIQVLNLEQLCALVLFLIVSLVIGILSEISLKSQERAR